MFALFAVGTFRIGEIVAAVLLRALGTPSDELAQLFGFVAVAVATAIPVFLSRRWRRSSGGSFTVARSGDGSEWTPDQLQAMAELQELADGDTSPLRQVLPIGKSVAADGVKFDVIAVELRDAMGRVTFAIHDPVGGEEQRELESRIEKVKDLSSIDFPAWLRPVVRISDDVGRSYDSTQIGGGGSGHGTYRHELAFAPAVPADASSLTLTIERLTTEPEFPAPMLQAREARVIEGPWIFEVPIGEPSR